MKKESNPPPSEKLQLITKALNVTSDELLGIKDIKGNGATLNKKILKTAKLMESLPKSDQKAVLHYIDALVKKNAPAKTRG